MIVQKTATTFRCCIDYRGLNSCVKPASWPLPNTRGLFERIGHNNPIIFGVMDLSQGYHQLGLDDASKILTAFISPTGIYQFTRLPFGPTRAPSFFQEQMVTKVLNGLLYRTCEMYLDDCIVYAASNEEFLERLEEVFQRFRARGLLLKAKKCKFGMAQIEYIGRVISKDGLSMSDVKIQKVLDFARPRTNHQLRALLGLANYFRGFVPNHSIITKPLTSLVQQKASKTALVQWNPEATKAFHTLKVAISNCPLMYFLDETSPIRLYTDASDYGIGGVLFQIVEGIWRPISFVSKSFTPTQTRWSTIQKEAYAIFHCCQQMDSLLRDRQFTIHTDHLNLTYMKQEPSSMVARWSIAMQELDYSIHFVPGTANEWADTLSRICPNILELSMDYTPKILDSPGLIVAAIEGCPDTTPEQLEWLEQCHNHLVGHGGLDRTLEKLAELGHNWLYMRYHIRTFIRFCPCCQKMSAVRISINAHHFATSAHAIFDVLNIDFVGPFPDESHVLVIIDAYSRWTELYHCDAATAVHACRCLLEHFGRFGAPNQIRSDRGPQFANDLISKFLLATGTPHNLTLAYSKQENAIVERVNREVNRHLRAFMFETLDPAKYKDCLPFVQRIINSSVHASTGVSPAELLLGNRINLSRGILTPFNAVPASKEPTSRFLAELMSAQEIVHTTVRERLTGASDQRLLDQPPLTMFPIGSYVLAEYQAGPPSRLHTRLQGPMEVIEHKDMNYVVRNIVSKKTKSIYGGLLRPFIFNPAVSQPMDTARRDYMEFFIEAIKEHRGDIKKLSSLTFLVKWLNYDDYFNSW